MGRRKLKDSERKSETITFKTDLATIKKIEKLMKVRLTSNRSEAIRYAVWKTSQLEEMDIKIYTKED